MAESILFVTLFDPATNTRARTSWGGCGSGDEDGDYYQWHDGNYSCDCNKRIALGLKGATDEDNLCGDTIKLEKMEYASS